MNCRQGDMAIVIGCGPYALTYALTGTNIGKVVTCLEVKPPGFMSVLPAYGPVWEIDRKLRFKVVEMDVVVELPVYPDRFLMPITPPPGMEDEEELDKILDETNA